MSDIWKSSQGVDITSAFRGITTPLQDILNEIHGRQWEPTVNFSSKQFVAKAKSPHGETLEAVGPTDATAAAHLLLKIMRRETARGGSQRVAQWSMPNMNNAVDVLAQQYAKGPIYEPKAAPFWKQLADDSVRRAEVIKQQLKVEVVPDPEPYTTPAEMCKDVHQNQHFFVSSANSQHPMWSVEQNVAFRIVHDVLGHCVSGGDFGWQGEIQACSAHFPLLTPDAQKALYVECILQTAAGAYYRSFMPQKVFDPGENFDKLQQEQNPDNHQGVHPSQSLAPQEMPQVQPSTPQGLPWSTQVPHEDFQGGLPVFGKVAMAERTGDPELDSFIDSYMKENHDYIDCHRHPDQAAGNCVDVSAHFASWLKAKGINATTAQEGQGILKQDDSYVFPPRDGWFPPQWHGINGEDDWHDAVVVQKNGHTFLIDFTASQYGESEFPLIQRLDQPAKSDPWTDQQGEEFEDWEGPTWKRTFGSVAGKDPNSSWESGIEPMPNSAYLWGGDPLQAQDATDNAMKIDTGWANMKNGNGEPDLDTMRQAITNAFRVVLLSPRKDLRWNAIHYQDIDSVPATVTDPKRYWDTLDGKRESWNQARGFAPGSHKPYWKELAQFKRYIRASHPDLDEWDADEKADREFMHMWNEEEDRITSDPKNAKKTADEIDRKVAGDIGKRLKALMKPSTPETDHGHEQLYLSSLPSDHIDFCAVCGGTGDGENGEPNGCTECAGTGDVSQGQVWNRDEQDAQKLKMQLDYYGVPTPLDEVYLDRHRRDIGSLPTFKGGLPKSMENLENWKPGHYGKGIVKEDGSVFHWKTNDDGGYGRPHHMDIEQSLWNEPHKARPKRGYFYLHPDGRTMVAGRQGIGWPESHSQAMVDAGLQRPEDETKREFKFEAGAGGVPEIIETGGPPTKNVEWYRGLMNRRPWSYHPELNQAFIGQPGQTHHDIVFPPNATKRYNNIEGYVVSPDAEGEVTDSGGGNPGEVGHFRHGDQHADQVARHIADHLGEPYHSKDPKGEFAFTGGLNQNQYDLEGNQAGKYGAFMGGHLKAIAQISQHVDELLEAAVEDVKEHDGSGHHFRAKTLSLGISGVGPKVASFAWLLLQPATSQLATIDVHMMDVLGHNYEKEMNNRDYFKFERELQAGRDASGYGHVPLGQFQWNMWDHKRTGPGTHQDHSAMKVLDPTPHDQVEWAPKPPDQEWIAPDWWANTQPARDQVAADWDQNVATQFSRNVTPRFAKKKVAGSSRIPWILWGEMVWVGQPGETFMNLARRQLNYSMEDVWKRLPEYDFSAGSYDPTQRRVFPQDQITDLQQETILRNLQ